MLENYVAIVPLPNGDNLEFFGECDGSAIGVYHERHALAQRAVRESKLTTPRNRPQEIEVKIFKLQIKQGKLERVPCESCRVTLPLVRMVQAEFDAEQAKLVERVPEEFRPVLGHMAWERGHSAGFEEVVLILTELVDTLCPAIEAYANRILRVGDG